MASTAESAPLPSNVANKDDSLANQRNSVATVPTPIPSGDKRRRSAVQKRTPPSVDVWCRILIGKIFEGSLQGLNRVSSLISHLEPSRQTAESASQNIDQASTGAKKNYVYVANPFTTNIVHEAYRHFGNRRNDLSLPDIYAALASNDLSRIVDPATLPMDPKSPLVAFCLILLYMKLIASTPETTFAIYSVLDRIKDRKIDFDAFSPGLKLETFTRSIVERRLRFVDDGTRSSLFFNELFETGQLGFLNIQKKVDNIIKEEHYGDIKTRTEKVRDSIQQQDCFYRMQAYIGKSERIVLANLRFLNEQRQDLDESIFAREENVALLVRLIREGVAGQLEEMETLEQSLRILTKWCLYRDLPPFKQKYLRETALLVEQLFEPDTLTERLLPLAIMFMGTASEVLVEKDITDICFKVLVRLLRDQPAQILRSRFLAIILYGYGSLLVNVSPDEFVEILKMLVELWALPLPRFDSQAAVQTGADSKGEMDAFLKSKASDSGPNVGPQINSSDKLHYSNLPTLEDQIRFLHLFATVYNGRRAKSEERLMLARRALASRQKQLSRSQQRSSVTPPPLPALDQVRDQEDEWLISASQALEALFKSPTSPTSTRFMSLFAAMGIFKEMMKPEDATPSNIQPRVAYEAFNTMITTAIMSNLTGKFPAADALSRDWRRAVAVICVNIDKSLPWISDDILLELVVDVMLDDILSIDWLFTTPLPPLPELMQRIEQHKQQGIYRMANVFVRASSVLFQHASSESLRSAIMVRLASFSQRLFVQWREFLASPTANAPLSTAAAPATANDPAAKESQAAAAASKPAAATIEKAMKPVLNTVFLSLSVFSKLVHKKLSYDQGMHMFDALSHLEFCAVKGTPLLASVLNELLSVVEAARPVFASKLISSYSYLSDPKKLTRSTLDSLDRMSISRLKYLLLVLEVVIARGNGLQDPGSISPIEEQYTLLQQPLLPLLFLSLSHLNRSVNKRTHAVFKQIFLHNHPLREEVIPYYLKVSLDTFPEITAFESLNDTTSAIIQSLPGAHPLAALTIRSISEKIRTMKMSKNTVYLLVILFRMVEKVNVYVLPFLLSTIEGTVRQSPKRLQETLCKLLFKIISSNNDYSRKETCIKWYLELAHSVGVRQKPRAVGDDIVRPLGAARTLS